MKAPEEMAARSFAILPRSAILGKARQRILTKIGYSNDLERFFYICTLDPLITVDPLQVHMEHNI